MIDETFQAVAQFGVAGLMGALWVWERSMTRRREAQLTAIHERLIGERHQLRELMRVMHRNTRAFERFEQTQGQLKEIIARLCDDRSHPRAS